MKSQNSSSAVYLKPLGEAGSLELDPDRAFEALRDASGHKVLVVGSAPDRTSAAAEELRDPAGHIVLVVDSQPDRAQAIARNAEALGHQASICTSTTEAIRRILDQRSVDIVIADAKCEPLGGLWLAQEIALRFTRNRQISVIISSEQYDQELLIGSIRAKATDIIIGSPTLIKVSDAINRGLQFLSDKRRVTIDPTLHASRPLPLPGNDTEEVQSDDAQTLYAAKCHIKARRTRSKFFEPWLLSSPTWDIILELTLAALEGQSIAVSSICALTECPASTALRHVKMLEEAGIVSRASDSNDRRRC